MKEYSLAKCAYDAYCAQTGGVSLISGDKLPDFGTLKTEIQDAWLAAAKAVEAACFSVKVNVQAEETLAHADLMRAQAAAIK